MLYSNKSSPCWWVKPWKYGFMTLLYQHSGLRNVKASEFGDSLPSRGWHIRRPASTKETDATKSTLGIFFGHPTEWDRRGRVEKKVWPERWDPRFPEMLLETSLAEYHLDNGGPIWVIPNWIKKLENEMMGLILPILEICGIPWNSTHLGAPDFFEHPMNIHRWCQWCQSRQPILKVWCLTLDLMAIKTPSHRAQVWDGLRLLPMFIPLFKTRNTWQQLKKLNEAIHRWYINTSRYSNN